MHTTDSNHQAPRPADARPTRRLVAIIAAGAACATLALGVLTGAVVSGPGDQPATEAATTVAYSSIRYYDTDSGKSWS
jgi:hypothetical protein